MPSSMYARATMFLKSLPSLPSHDFLRGRVSSMCHSHTWLAFITDGRDVLSRSCFNSAFNVLFAMLGNKRKTRFFGLGGGRLLLPFKNALTHICNGPEPLLLPLVSDPAVHESEVRVNLTLEMILCPTLCPAVLAEHKRPPFRGSREHGYAAIYGVQNLTIGGSRLWRP